MSDLLIRGMEMPTSSRFCPFTEMSYAEVRCTVGGCYEWHKARLCDGCPLVHIPSHGRLGDLDVLAQQIEHERFHHTHTDGLAARHHVAEYGHFLKAISDAPTIIPASE